MKSILYAFLGGALVGGAIALLFAPESGEATRARIKELLKNRGLDFSDEDVEKLRTVGSVVSYVEDHT